jgi:predicted DCC family thiol-disulfide oxidoreductase YuxK
MEQEAPGLLNTLTPERWLVVFDGSCGPCSASARRLARLDRVGRIAWLPLQAPGLGPALGLEQDELHSAAWALAPDGALLRGSAAMAAAADAALGFPGTLVWLATGALRRPAEAVYSWLARNRSRFPGHAYLDDNVAELPAPTAAEIARRTGRLPG